jgi:hypothetical protein
LPYAGSVLGQGPPHVRHVFAGDFAVRSSDTGHRGAEVRAPVAVGNGRQDASVDILFTHHVTVEFAQFQRLTYEGSIRGVGRVLSRTSLTTAWGGMTHHPPVSRRNATTGRYFTA